jgi:sialate O-acetylesterase
MTPLDIPLRPTLLVVLTSLFGWIAPVSADLRLPTLFSDHAVLQRDKDLPVWGWADGGAAVDVEINGQRASATADATGRWRATLSALKAGGPFEMTFVSGGARRTLRDVWVGDVWLCAGQSNMAHGLDECENGEKDMAAADHPQLRMFRVRESIADAPRDDAAGAAWAVCSPRTISSFSAVGYYFGRKIHAEAGVPVGLLVCAWGGSSVTAWMSRDALDEPRIRRQVPFDVFGWREPTRPNKLYAGMLHPLAPFGIRGALWYQGETECEPPYNAYLYRDFLAAMIADWRALWREPALPFYIVQLPILKTRDRTVLRESQDRASRLPRVGMITTIDISRPLSAHPGNKHEIAGRLADLVLADEYGQARPAYGPRCARHAVDGPLVRVELERASGLKTIDGHPPRAFAVAGDDRKFFDANATLDGAAIVISHPSVAKPVAVRYAWSAAPDVNVVNDQSLPLAPFRTDDWPVAGQEDAWVALPTKAQLPNHATGATITATTTVTTATTITTTTRPAWTFAGSQLDPQTIAQRRLVRPQDRGAVQVHVPDRPLADGATRSPRMFWRTAADAFKSVEPSKGCTVELEALVFSATLPLSGLELHVRVPHADGRIKQYRLAIAPARVFGLHGDEVRVLGHNLNTSGSHAYRIAVRPEGSAQVYFDSTELGTLPGEWIEQSDAAQPGIAIGKPYDGGTLTATIERVSYDVEGAFQP